MSTLARWVSYLSSLGVGVSGAVLVWMIYFLSAPDPYAIVNHSAQPLWKNIHIWLAPALTLNIGWLWSQHAWSYFRGKVSCGRKSGIGLLATSLAMIFSGGLLQTALSETARNFWSLFHIVSSLSWICCMIFHILIHRRAAQTPMASR